MNRPFLVLALVGLLLIGGCSGVMMNAEYSAQLDKTAAWSADASARAKTGQYTTTQMAEALDINAQAWQAFRDARDGKAE